MNEKPLQLVDITQQPYSLVPATIVPDFSSDRVDDVERTWSPFRDQLRVELAKRGIAIEHGHWNWKNKLESIVGRRCQFIAVDSMNSVQGLAAVLNVGIPSKIDPTLELLYLEYIENAPWNISPLLGMPRLVPVGKLLLAATVQESQNRGYDGRIGLHSLPQAESFYRSMGMTDFGRDHAYYGLSYFEIESKTALQWLREMEA